MIKDTGTFIICKKNQKNLEKKIRKYGEKNQKIWRKKSAIHLKQNLHIYM